MEFRELSIDESNRIKEINGEQWIKRAWREVDGKRQLVEINWMENELPNGLAWHMEHFELYLQNDGKAYGCFEENKLIGYAVMGGKCFGTTANYLLLDQLFISKEHRRKGIGKKLFLMCAAKAKQLGADKLYICAGSAEETIAFYFAIGCVEAIEINQELYESDPRDFQLEYVMK